MIFSNKKVNKSKFNPYTRYVDELFSKLTQEEILKILSFLSEQEILFLFSVNRQWNQLITQRSDWKDFFEKNEKIKISSVYSLPNESLSFFQKSLRRNFCLLRVRESLVEFITHQFFESLEKSTFKLEIFEKSTKIEFQKNLISRSREFGLINEVEEIWSDTFMIYTGIIFF
jgi:hypothetical protein